MYICMFMLILSIITFIIVMIIMIIISRQFTSVIIGCQLLVVKLLVYY